LINFIPDFCGEKNQKILESIIKKYSETKNTESYSIIFGEDGFGKSRFAGELKKFVDVPVFINTTFNQFNKRIPLSGIKSFFSCFFDILDIKEELKEKFGVNITKGISKSNSLLIHFLPQLEEYLERSEGEGNLSNMLKSLLLNIAGSGIPLFVFLDDFHHCDKASVEIFDAILGEKKPVHFVFTVKKAESNENDFYNVRLKERSENVEAYFLDPLNQNDLNSLIENVFYGKLENKGLLIDTLLSKVNLTPLLIIESVKLLIQNGIVYFDDDFWDITTDALSAFIFPNNLNDLILKRINELDSEETEILRYCSAIGNAFDIAILDNIAFKNPDLYDASFIHSALEKANDKGIIEDIGNGRYVFKSNDIRDDLYASLDSENKAYFHELCADYIDENMSDKKSKATAAVFELAYHYSRSNDLEKGVLYLIKAGEKALEMHSRAEAVDYYEDALRSIDYFGNEEKKNEIKIKITFECIKAMSMLGNYSKGIELLNDIEKSVNDGKSKENLAKYYFSQGYINYMAGNTIAGFQWFSQAVPLAEAENLENLLGFPYQVIGASLIFTGKLREGLSYLEKSVPYVERFNPELLSKTYVFIAWHYSFTGQSKKAIYYLKKTEEHLDKISQTEELITVYHYLGTMYGWSQVFEKGFMYENKAREIALKTDNKAIVYSTYLGLTYINYVYGDFETASKKGNEGLLYSQKHGIAVGLYLYYLILSDVYYEMGEYEKVFEYGKKGIDVLMMVGNVFSASDLHRLIGLSHTLKDTPDYKLAEEHLLTSIELAKQVDYDLSYATSYGAYSAYLYRTGNISKALEYEKLCLEYLTKIDMPWVIKFTKRDLADAKKAAGKSPISPEKNQPEKKVQPAFLSTKTEIKHPAYDGGHKQDEKQFAEIPEGVYALGSISKEIMGIIEAFDIKDICRSYFKYVFLYTPFERGFLYVSSGGKLECVAGFDKSGNDVSIQSTSVCKHALRNALVSASDLYIEDALENADYKLTPQVHSNKIRSIYVSLAKGKNGISAVYLDNDKTKCSVIPKARELLKHYQNITSVLVSKELKRN
jgi:tetratricopeptide (TPR) repeat protein